MVLPTESDLEHLIDAIYKESTKVFEYDKTASPHSMFIRFLQTLNKIKMGNLIPFRLEKDRLILRFYRNTSPYQILLLYIYTLAFIKYDNSINNILIEEID